MRLPDISKRDYYTIAELASRMGKSEQVIRSAMRGEGATGALPFEYENGVRVVRKSAFHAHLWAMPGRHGSQRLYRYDEQFNKVYD